ncbi:MAG TPA: ATPase, partial [Alphaproteobacteria bacterium]|nr:ATPase [Alphaproteobacteria bacterium]
MRIDRLTVTNFKGFKSREFMFHPQFNLIVGMNGTGKTSVLDALGVAAGAWHRGIGSKDAGSIRPEEVMLRKSEHNDRDEDGESHSSIQWEHVYPCEVSASGLIRGQNHSWTIEQTSKSRLNWTLDTIIIMQMAEKTAQSIRNGSNIPLPLISYYSLGRSRQEPHGSSKITDPMEIVRKEDQSRLSEYWNTIDPNFSVIHLTRWIARQSWITYQQSNRVPAVFLTVKKAMVSCIEGALDLYFDADLGEVIVALPTGTLPFSYLSDGQRSMLAMVGDIALKAAKLNP